MEMCAWMGWGGVDDPAPPREQRGSGAECRVDTGDGPDALGAA